MVLIISNSRKRLKILTDGGQTQVAIPTASSSIPSLDRWILWHNRGSSHSLEFHLWRMNFAALLPDYKVKTASAFSFLFFLDFESCFSCCLTDGLDLDDFTPSHPFHLNELSVFASQTTTGSRFCIQHLSCIPLFSHILSLIIYVIIYIYIYYLENH